VQKTIAKEISIEGIGLHTGKKARLVFKPHDVNKGIEFKRIDLAPNRTIAISDFEFGSHKRRTAISKDGVEIHTVEHLMAALWALSIDNILVEIDSEELPGLDGSAKDYYLSLKAAGIREQDAPRKNIKILEPVWCEKDDSFVGVFPSDRFKVSYILQADTPSIGRQCLSIDLNEESFYKEISSARTFCLKEEAEALLKSGLGRGANLSNTLVMDKEGPINNVLRFPDEPVRHKILDLIGDLYLAGSPIEARVIGIRSGHELNMELVGKIRNGYRLSVLGSRELLTEHRAPRAENRKKE